MTPLEIQQFCIQGTDAYLRHLEANGRGEEVVPVHEMTRVNAQDGTPAVFKLVLAAKVYATEGIAIRVLPPRQDFGPADFTVLEYDADARCLLIEVRSPELEAALREGEEVKVVSDLKFLVRNVRAWLQQNGHELTLPTALSLPGAAAQAAAIRIAPLQEEADERAELDAGQREAVHTALTKPLCYVWGPPGTGKTRRVMVAAVLRLMRAGRKVGIFAPTNNALEQAMRAVIEASALQGAARHVFLRLGAPSPAFAHDFREVCEVQRLQQQIAARERQLRHYRTTLHHRRGAAVLNSVAVLQNEIGKLSAMLRLRRKRCEILAQRNRRQREGKDRLNGLERGDGELRRLLAGGIVKELLSKLRGERAGWERELAEITRAIARQREAGRRCAHKAERLSRTITASAAKIEGQVEIIRHTPTQSERLNGLIAMLDLANPETVAEQVAQLARATTAYREQTAAIAAEHTGLTDDEIRAHIAGLSQEIQELQARETKDWIDSAQVIGMTLDRHAKESLNESIPFSHVFLDEAGYAPVVKALTLMRRNVPVTLLGDHKQLGPVCDMKRQIMQMAENRRAIVWRKSALYVGDLFAAELTVEQLLAEWFQEAVPNWQRLPKADLRTTYRFGQNLAEVLEECVYQGLGLVSGASNGELQVTCLDAVPAGQPAEHWQSVAEADQIASYLAAHPEFENGGEASWAILTPYRNQVALLRARLPEAGQADRILTVAKAQGREWDTVFLSVVDGTVNGLWLANALNPISGGLYVMNTAISRARQHLVIVCERHFWEERQEQGVLFGEQRRQLLKVLLQRLAQPE